MNMSQKIIIAAAILASSSMAGFATEFLLPAQQPADVRSTVLPVWINPILIANNQIALDAVGNHLNYHESTPIFPVLDGEKGAQPGLQITGSAMFDLSTIRNIYVTGQFTWANGNTDYWAPVSPL